MRPLYFLTPQRASGFSLIEVLIALMILSVGALGIAAMTAVSLKSKDTAYARTQANDLAYAIFDRMRANRATAIQHGYDIGLGAAPSPSPPGDCIGATADCNPAEIANLDLNQWKNSLARFLPAGDGSIRTVDLKEMTQVTISVQWSDRRANRAADGGNGAPAAVTLSFVVSSAL